MQASELITTNSGADERLSSWKEIATYLKCGVRTVQRWESLEGLPVHRHQHQKNGTVYAFRSELDAWRKNRTALQAAAQPQGEDDLVPGTGISTGQDRRADQTTGQPSTDGAAAATFDIPEREPEVRTETRLEVPALNGEADPSEPRAKHLPPAPAAVSALPDVADTKRVNKSNLLPYLLPATLAVVISAAVFIARERLKSNPHPEVTRKMLAVLPFANLSGDPEQDYFSDGLTEEMITELGRLDPERLGVIARTSAMKYKHTQEDIAQIGKELGVSYVLEGSVRRAQNRVRVSAQLIQVSDQTHLWAQSFEGDTRNVLGVQEQVADAITQKIQLNLGRGQQGAARASQTLDLDAHDNYLKGRYFWNLRTNSGFRTAIGYFDASIGRDPNYSQAYAGLADCYTLLALYGEPVQQVMPKAKAAALKSVALNDLLPEAHTSLGAVDALWDWNWPAAENEFQRAISLDPNYSPAHHWYANLYLIPQGRLNEAIAEMKLAATLDPVSLIVTTDLGWTYFVAHQYDKAFEQYSKALEMSPDFVPVHFRLAQYYFQTGAYDKALLQSQESMRLDGRPGVPAGPVPSAAPQMATEEDYRRYIRQRLETPGTRPDSGDSAGDPPGDSSGQTPFRPNHEGSAVYYAELGDTGKAIENLQIAVSERDPGLIYLSVEPTFARLHSDARFQRIERRIGLPAP